MTEIQRSLAALCDVLGEPIHRAVDLERALKLDKKLAWQAFRLTRSPSLAFAGNVPPRSSVRRLVEAARRRQTPDPVLRRVAEAFDAFEQFVATHAGDRAGLLSMISGLSHQDSEAFDLKTRKSLFRSNAHIWGIQAQTRVRTMIYNSRPGTAGSGLGPVDVLSVQGEIGLQRLRDSQPLSISVVFKTSRAPFTEGQSKATGTVRSRSSGSASAECIGEGPELLKEFCSQPLPAIRPRPTELGGVETELLFPASGRSGAVTLYSSVLLEDTGEGEHGVFFGKSLMTIPTEVIVLDMLVPVGWTDPSTARMGVYARRDLPEHVYEMRRADLMPQRETLAYMGAMEGVPPVGGGAGVARHPEAVRHVLERAGWLGTKFDVYRCRVEYPVLHSMLFYAADRVRHG
jgi:hypothetical protein